MGVKTTVWVTTSFVGVHRWAAAPEEVAFLRDYHRHVFHVRVEVPVRHDDRDVEFLMLKKRVDDYLAGRYRGVEFDHSCEHVAADLLARFGACEVQVSEDGENGATVRQEAPAERARCFVGTEAEGPNRGKKMLFVPGVTSPQQFWDAVAKVGDVWGVYYGAGNDRAVRDDTLAAILEECMPDNVTVEVDSLRGLPFPVGVTVVSLDPADRGKVDFIKAVSDRIVWEGCGTRYVTAPDDPLFAQDREV